jgi:hypothetical protein
LKEVSLISLRKMEDDEGNLKASLIFSHTKFVDHVCRQISIHILVAQD